MNVANGYDIFKLLDGNRKRYQLWQETFWNKLVTLKISFQIAISSK